MRAWLLLGLPTIGPIMQALRLNEVLMRVVAWHNRHPLARRITATQVHSIGEVVLPFASARPAPAAPNAPGAPAMPMLQDLLDPPASQPDDGLPVLADPGTDPGVDPGVDPGTDPASTTTHPPAAWDAPLASPGHPPPEPGDDAADNSPAAPARPASPSDPAPSAPDAPASDGPPSPAPATDPEPESAPVLSMEEEADDLFGGGAAASPELPGQAADNDAAALDDDGPEVLIELSADLEEPTDTPPDPTAADAAPDIRASDADRALLTAAFGTATADDPPPASGDQAADSPSLGADASAAAGPADQADPADQPDHGALPGADPALAAEAHPPLAATAPHPSPHPPPHPPPNPSPPAQALAATPPPPGWWARRRAWLQGWRPGRSSHGLPKLAATFSRDFIWPLRPARVARWARQHGSLHTLAPPDWPQRQIDTDNHLQAKARSQGLPHDVPLHVLTAAIGVGDRRIRVLIDAQGHILGPRAYSPPKLAGLASVVALGLLGAGWGGLPRGDSLSPQQASAAVAAAASAAAQAASAAALAAAAASAAESVWRAQQAGLATAASPPLVADEGDALPDASPVAAVPVDQPTSSATKHEPAPADAQTPDRVTASSSSSSSSSSSASASASASAPTPTTAFAIPALGPALPAFSPADKQAARLQSDALRSGKAAAIAAATAQPPATVFAIVTRPTREKESAARSLALIRASSRRLGDDAPTHGELLQDQGIWRAAWWPFESQADAERARVMLAARGVPSEVVEF